MDLLALDDAIGMDASTLCPSDRTASVEAPAHAIPRRTAARDFSTLADSAVQALIDEACLTPKPALVDRRGSGAHRDLDLDTMLRSARSLRPAFHAIACAAARERPTQALRERLAQIGRDGEAAMLSATGGSNAHRGAIWIVGLLCAGAACCMNDARAATHDRAAQYVTTRGTTNHGSATHDVADCGISNRGISTPDASTRAVAVICATAAHIARFDDRYAPAISADSNGARVARRYGAKGARGEARDGFPHVVEIGLPALQRARDAGLDENNARLEALLAIMASLDDTCLLHRGGPAALETAQRGASQVMDAGGLATEAGRTALTDLDHRLLALNASPGGSADLLAATLFLDTLDTL
jgi:triphosphoribosyl-dephospho-CoA synthase